MRYEEITKVCDRCAVRRRERDATHTDRVVINGMKYDIDLCDEHHFALEHDIKQWTDLGTLKGQPNRFDVAPVPRTITVPKPGPKVDPVAAELRRAAAMNRPELPATAGRWLISDHAQERMRERGVDTYEVLMAAERPEKVIPRKEVGRGPRDSEERWRGDLRVYVNPDTAEVLTVMRPSQSDQSTPQPEKVSA